MNKQQLQQEITELQKQLEEKQKALSAMPDKWEPKGGDFFVNINGKISHCPNSGSLKDFSEFGVEYTTREQAEKAAKAMRAHNRLLAYVAELAPDMPIGDAYVAWSCDSGNWDVFVNRKYRTAGAVHMPYEVAAKLCNKLNSGEVEL